MNVKHHAWLARRLIEACGGLPEAAEHCRLKKSRLSEAQIPGSGAFLPADVIVALEAYCGEAIYSQAMVDDRPGVDRGEDPAEEACEATQAAADVQRLFRKLRLRTINRREREEILGDLDSLDVLMRSLRQAVES